MSFLDNLRSKPPHERKLVALSAAAIIALIIFVIWASALMSTLAQEGIEQPEQQASVLESQKTTTYEVFMEAVNKRVERVKSFDIFDFSNEPIEYKSDSN